MIFGTAYDESLGDQLRVTVIATGLSSARKAVAQPPLSVVRPPAHPVLRTGTDNLPILNHMTPPGPAMQAALQVPRLLMREANEAAPRHRAAGSRSSRPRSTMTRPCRSPTRACGRRSRRFPTSN